MNKIFAPFLPPWAETGLQPAFYDMESGTVLQQTARMYAKVQQLTRLFNELSEETKTTVEEYIAKFTELKDFVDDYFDNLDVQEEVNHKLDKMAEDGTLTDLLREYEFDGADTLYFKTVFVKSTYADGVDGMNGGCVLPDNTFIQYTGKEVITHYAQDGSIINTNTIAGLGHGNSLSYNDKTGKLYLTGSGVTNNIYVIDPTTLELEDTINVADKGYPDFIGSMCYDSANDTYICMYWWGDSHQPYLWKVDNEFNLISSVNTGFTDIQSTSNIGIFGNYVGVNNSYTHQVMLFDKNDLSYFKTIKIDEMVSDTWFITEEQWFDTRDDGKIVLGFMAGATANPHLGTGTYIYSICDPHKNYESCPIKDKYPPKPEFYYIDHTCTLNDRNGTGGKPFNNIYEAMNSALRTRNCTGKVTFRFSNGTETIYSPVFNNNKHYIIWYPNNTIDFLGGIGVDTDCTVETNRPVTLKLLDTKINPFNDGAADICCNGNLIIKGVFKTPDNETPTISGSGYFEAPFEDSGLDVQNFYGNIKCTGNQLFAVEHVIQNSRNAYNNPYMNTEYHGVKGTVTNNSGYTVPPLAKTMMVVPKITINGENYEPCLWWNPNTYTSVAFPDSTGHQVYINIATNGKVTLYPSNSGTIDRVKVIAL